MSKRDKASFAALISIVALVVFAIVTIQFGQKLPWIIVGIVAMLLQFIYVMPAIAKMYYEVNGAKIGASRWIPLWSDIQIFSPLVAKIAMGATAVCAVIFLVSFIPPTFIDIFAGEIFSAHWRGNVIIVFIFAVAITNFIYGFGQCGVLKNVNFMVLDNTGEEVWKLEIAFYFLLMLPMLRIPTLMMIRSKLKSLVESGYGVNEEATEVEEVGEES